MTIGVGTDIFASLGQALSSTALSRPTRSVWAKTGGHTHWLPLHQHMKDSVHIAERLLSFWLSEQVLQRWEKQGCSRDQMQISATFLAGVHDLGKAAPAFVAQSELLAKTARDAGLPCRSLDELKDDRKNLPHSLISQWELNSWLCELGVEKKAAMRWSSTVGAHHGKPQPRGNFKHPEMYPNGMGGPAWTAVRRELLEFIADATGFRKLVINDGLPPISLPIAIELAGLIIVTDWIASNTRYFPLHELGYDPDETPQRAEFGWDELAMPAPWQPPPSDEDIDSLFRHRFNWPDDATPYPLQRVAAEAARRGEVGMLFIESTTGSGKTEAALIAAEIIAAQRGSQGLLVALPTQATTNAMFHRLAAWVSNQPKPPNEVAAWALSLGHGKSRLNPEFAALIAQVEAFEKALPNTLMSSMIYESDDGTPTTSEVPCNAVAHTWFLGAKRRMLANFSAVTIDQLLMASLQRRHLMLAHIALSGKVVIIDEAHASDEYMNVYLDSTLSWLGAYEVPVIVLSATLTKARRQAMMCAYAPDRKLEIDALNTDPTDYPLVTVLPSTQAAPIAVHGAPDTSHPRSVRWQWHSPEPRAIVETLSRLLEGGGCALVIRNTVSDAQETAKALAEAEIAPVLINHAGFLAVDRAANDVELEALFGKRSEERPDKAIVCATQVVEQSLDIDFDVLITDLAPMDLLIQRLGRMHRHRRNRPTLLSAPQVMIVANVDHTRCEPTTGSVAVYGRHLLVRTAATLLGHGPTISLPDDIAPLVSTALGSSEVGPPSWHEELQEASAEHTKLIIELEDKAKNWCIEPWRDITDKRYHLGNWMKTQSNMSPNALEVMEIQMGATVRDSEPTLEVIIIPMTPDGLSAIHPPWIRDEILDVTVWPDDSLAREIASWSLRLPSRLTRYRIDALIECISGDPQTKRWPLRQHSLLRGELLLPMKQQEEGETQLFTQINVGKKDFFLTYSPETGLEVTS